MLQNGQMELSDLDIWCGKTSPERSVQTTAKISDKSSKKSAKSKTKEPLFLDLRGTVGEQAAVSWVMGIPSLGEFSMQSFTECPNVAVASHLSQILEDTPHPKYCLSETACKGILRRAEARGVEIHPILKEVLQRQAGGGKLTPVIDFSHRRDVVRISDESPTLTSMAGTGGNNVPCVFTMDYAAFNQGKGAHYKPDIKEADYAPTLTAKGAAAVCYGVPLNFRPENMIPQVEESSTLCNGTAPGTHNGVIRYGKVRRLTPLECERLQGYPDNYTDIGEWTDESGKRHKTSDTARYKALGNSIAIPPWKWVLKRLCGCYERDATMASLFDGIGGFPYIWEQLNGKGSCLWASEIEPFPIAVTKYHFGAN